MAMKAADYQVLLYYKYIDITDPVLLMEQQRILCQKLKLNGRIIVANEGINGTVEGLSANIQKYIEAMKADVRFADTHFKISTSDGRAFPKLSVKVRSEIVTAQLRDKDINPNQVTGKYLTAEQLHQWFEDGKEFYIVDMRNDYEQLVGHFDGSILPGMANFRDLPAVLHQIEHLKNKTILTVCTGGVRCEKASGFLVDNGFNNVYQLYGGIVTYMEKYPNQNFKGKLYVFDNRILVGFNTDSPEHQVIGRCEKCDQTSENYINCAYDICHKHYIHCQDCYSDLGLPFCGPSCELVYRHEHPTTDRESQVGLTA